ncbi:MAG: sensor histidine kinase [Candidatus Aminicenantes bacterium]|nr:sensor histidine kinase [Candidatus Aminicenantes bacterium]
MKDRKKILEKVNKLLLQGTWVNLYGPEGMGKKYIGGKVHRFIRDNFNDSHLPLMMDLNKINAHSVEEVEREVLKLLSRETKIEIPRGVDFFDRVTAFLKVIQKQVILLLINFDVVSREGALYIARELSKIYHYKDVQSVKLTVLACGADRLMSLSSGQTSPFHHAREIPLQEMIETEARELIKNIAPHIPDNIPGIFYRETKGYPALLEELVYAYLNSNLEGKNEHEIIAGLLDRFIDDHGEIRSNLLKRWLYNVHSPRFLSLFHQLLDNRQVCLPGSDLSREQIEFSGIFKVVNDNNIEFRTPFIEKFFQKYGTKKRIADHFWIFSSQEESCWEEGCKIYRDLRNKDRERNSGEIVGPVYRRLGDLVSSGGKLMAKKETPAEVFEILDNIMEYLFNVRDYFVGRQVKNGQEGDYKILFAPPDAGFKEGEKIDNPYMLELLRRCSRNKRDWVHSWNHGFLAFPMSSPPQNHMVLWIDNRSVKVLKHHNCDIVALASFTGMAVQQLERRKGLQESLGLLKEILAYDEDYVQFVDKDRKIRMMNHIAEENAGKWHPGKTDFIGEKCSRVFLGKEECSDQCACCRAFKDKQVHRNPENWPNPNQPQDILHMDVVAVPYVRNGQLEGVFQLARNVTAHRKAMDAVIKFSSARNEEEVYSHLLKAVAVQGVKRIRLYLPNRYTEEADKNTVGTVISKDCLGYEDDPGFEKKFRAGRFELSEKTDKFWHDSLRKSKVPVISRIRPGLKTPKYAEIKNRSVDIFYVPPECDSYRKEYKKENIEEWMTVGLIAGGKFFGFISVDKDSESKQGSFRILECDGILLICRAAAMALHRIAAPNIRKVIRVFRHTINQYLAAINNYIWAFAESDLPQEKRLTYAKIVDSELRRFDYFSRNMTAFLPEMGTPGITSQKLDIPNILEEINELFAYYFEKIGITFDISACSSPMCTGICSDEMVVRVILSNLLDNAAKALQDWKGEKKITVTFQEKPGHLIISIMDTGPGISEGHRERVFEPGYSVKKGQTGIGLPASRLMAQWIKSRITLDKKYKQGAKFDFKLADLSKQNK